MTDEAGRPTLASGRSESSSAWRRVTVFLGAEEERWGSIRGFLTGPAGLMPSELDDLAAALVE